MDGYGEEQVEGQLLPSRSQATRPSGSRRSTQVACEYSIPRSSQRDRMALETSSEIGIGFPSA